jgi:elongation factor Ts
MAVINAALVKQLRDATNVSMMECKRCLQEADGDMDKAVRLLREKGVATAAKKATRTANQGLIASKLADDANTGAIIEINCETDFVARNPDFVKFVDELAAKANEADGVLADIVKTEVVQKITEIGENVVVKRNDRFTLEGTGVIGSYIHMGGKVGVLVEMNCEKAETVSSDIFADAVKDVTLHIAASSPKYLTSDEVDAEELKSEREIFAKQVEGKPENIIDKIVDGKVKKYFSEICLVEQPFVKEPKQSVTEFLAEKSKAVDDSITIKRFVRYQLGE